VDRLRETASLEPDPREGGVAKRNLFETPRFFADLWGLEPGQAQRPHAHAQEDKCYFVLSGKAIVVSGSERYEAGPGAMVLCPAGEIHGVENPGPDPLRLLVFMAPHPRPPAGAL
jgi:mannose-6-phosphate isomerase-like protein (cupin superfamily)